MQLQGNRYTIKEKFIYVLNNTDMLAERIRELTTIQEVTEVTSEKVVCWANE